MRTTLDLPADLLGEAQRLLGFKSKTDTVVFSLRELIRRKRIDDLRDLLGPSRWMSTPSGPAAVRADCDLDCRIGR